jgi:hypothetical protein
MSCNTAVAMLSSSTMVIKPFTSVHTRTRDSQKACTVLGQSRNVSICGEIGAEIPSTEQYSADHLFYYFCSLFNDAFSVTKII